MSEGYSGSDISNVVNEALMLPVRKCHRAANASKQWVVRLHGRNLPSGRWSVPKSERTCRGSVTDLKALFPALKENNLGTAVSNMQDRFVAFCTELRLSCKDNGKLSITSTSPWLKRCRFLHRQVRMERLHCKHPVAGTSCKRDFVMRQKAIEYGPAQSRNSEAGHSAMSRSSCDSTVLLVRTSSVIGWSV